MPDAAWNVTRFGAEFGPEAVPLKGHALRVLAALVDHDELTIRELRCVWESGHPTDDEVRAAVARVNAALTSKFRAGIECRPGQRFRLLVR